ncbi:hypothetical protein ACFQQE_07415 [Glycomyces mayteni]
MMSSVGWSPPGIGPESMTPAASAFAASSAARLAACWARNSGGASVFMRP